MQAIADVAAITLSSSKERLRFFGCLSLDAPFLHTSDMDGPVEGFESRFLGGNSHPALTNQFNFQSVGLGCEGVKRLSREVLPLEPVPLRGVSRRNFSQQSLPGDRQA